MPWLTQYSRWDFLRDAVGFIELDNALIIFYLFISEVKSLHLSCQSNTNCLTSSFHSNSTNHILQTNSHFTPYLSICAVGDSSMSNLAHTARLLACQHPTLVLSMKISCIILFFILGWRFIVLGCCHSMYATLRILRVSYALQGWAKQTLFPFCWLLAGFQTQRSLEQTLLLFA